MAKNYLTIRIEDELRARLQAFADEDQRSLSSLIQIVLQDYSDTIEREGAPNAQ